MSIRLMTIVWDIPWPSQSALLVALKLADYANDEGGSIHPARDTLAKHAQTSLATVKRILAAFRDVGLLSVVQEGGKGPRSTTKYEFNLRQLMRLHDGYDEIQRAENTADGFVIVPTEAVDDGGEKRLTTSPLEAGRGSPDELRGSPEKIRGSIDEPRNTTLEPSSRSSTSRERASEDSNSDLNSEVKKAAVGLTITPAESLCWETWLKHLHDIGRSDLADAAVAAGEISVVGRRWPNAKSALPKIKRNGLTKQTERMVGGA